jgi:hypothetical protein
MSDALEPEVTQAILTLLKEAFEGPAGPSTYFIDNDPKAGFLASLEGLTPAEASTSPSPAAASIAGHAHHAAFHLEMSSSWIRGDRRDRDWALSWAVRDVDEKTWNRVRRELCESYEDLAGAIASEPAARGESLRTSIGAIAHAAYHLGAIRQRVAAARRDKG